MVPFCRIAIQALGGQLVFVFFQRVMERRKKLDQTTNDLNRLFQEHNRSGVRILVFRQRSNWVTLEKLRPTRRNSYLVFSNLAN
jgi:hypothetical protein